MRAILRAAVYRPVYTDGARRVAGPDEDRFTLEATSIERVLENAGGEPLPSGVVHVGGEPPADAALYGLLLGGPVSLGPGVPGWAEGLDHALRTDGSQLVVASRIAEGTAPETQSVAGDAAVCFLVGERSGTAELGVGPSDLPTSEDPVVAAFDLHQRKGSRAPTAWLGPWSAGGAEGRRTPGPRPGPRSSLDPVVRRSEGAYVPEARYLESLPSRWRFLAERCGACGELTFPSAGRCRRCQRSDRLETVLLPRDGGTVIARTWIGPGAQPTEFDPEVEATGPYGVVLVELVPGAHATLAVAEAEPEEVEVGSRVATRLRRLYSIDGAWRYGRKAIPFGPPRPPPTTSGARA